MRLLLRFSGAASLKRREKISKKLVNLAGRPKKCYN
jgi:hypothetical protein